MRRLWSVSLMCLLCTLACDDYPSGETRIVPVGTVVRDNFGCGEYLYMDVNVADFSYRTWHWLVLKDYSGFIVKTGYLYEVAPYGGGTITLTMRIDESDSLGVGTYFLSAEYTSDLLNAFNSAKRALAAEADTVKIEDYEQSCELRCTKPTGGNPNAGGWFHSVGPDLDGLKANVLVQYGNLCCGSCCNEFKQQFSCCYIALVRENPLGVNGKSQVSCGYQTLTFDYWEDIFHCRFCETIGNYAAANTEEELDWDLFLDITRPGPEEGIEHSFEIRFNRNTTNPTWEALCDDTVFKSDMLVVRDLCPDTLWKYAKGEWFEVQGEISSYETDMPGTKDEPVEITDMKVRYSTKQGYEPFNFNYDPDHVGSDDDNEWWAEIIENDTLDILRIWDKKLQAPQVDDD